MGIQAGSSAVTGVYLGDQLLAGGGDVDSIIQEAFDKPDVVTLGKLLGVSGQIIANSTAMAQVAASETAMAQVAASETAMAQVTASETAMAQVTASETAMAQVAASETAMAQVAASETAMAQVTASETAMAQVTASETAMAQVAASETAMAQVAASETAMAQVTASETAMAQVAASATAMAQVAASETAMAQVAASDIACNALYARKKRLGSGKYKGGRTIILEISPDNPFNPIKYGYATLFDGTKPVWANYKGRFLYFRQYKKYCITIKSHSGDYSWIDYFDIDNP